MIQSQIKQQNTPTQEGVVSEESYTVRRGTVVCQKRCNERLCFANKHGTPGRLAFSICCFGLAENEWLADSRHTVKVHRETGVPPTPALAIYQGLLTGGSSPCRPSRRARSVTSLTASP